MRFAYAIIGALIFFSSACSIPNLETAECIEARDTVKEFYSFHIGNDMAPTPKNLEQRERFITPELFRSVAGSSDGKTDYFTASTEYPRAFSDGGCSTVDPNTTLFDVLLFWRENDTSRQKIVKTEVVKRGDKWLINKVSE